LTVKLGAERIRKVHVALLILFFTQGFIATTIIPRVPEMIDQINVSFVTWGFIIGFAGLGSLVGMTLASKIVARFGTRQMALWGGTAAALFFACYPLTNSPVLFFIFNVASGFAMSVYNISMQSQSVALQKAVVGKTIIGKFHALWSIGAAISALVSGILVSFMPFWLHMFLVQGIAIGIFIFYGRHLLTPAEDEPAPPNKKSGKKVAFWKSPGQLWLVTGGLFAGVFPEGVMMDWSALYARDVLGLNASLGAVPYITFVSAMIIGRLSISRLTKAFHISELSKYGGLFGSAALGLGALSGPWIAGLDSVLALIVVSVLWFIAGLGLASMVPSFMTAAGYIRGLTTSQAVARMMVINSFSFMLAKYIMGAIAEGVNLVAAFMFPTVLMFIAGWVAGIVAKRAKRSEAVANSFPPTGSVAIVEQN
jgi:MFS family permease